MSATISPEAAQLAGIASTLLGCEIAEIAVVGTVDPGAGAAPSVVACVAASKVSGPRFRHALEMEETYSDSLIGFVDDEPPYYGAAGPRVDLDAAAAALGIDRVLCLVAVGKGGELCVGRNYEGVDVTLIQAAKIQFERVRELLAPGQPQGGRRLQ